MMLQVNKCVSKVKEVKMEEVIVIEVCEGNGDEKSPYMLVRQYWTKNGVLIGITKA